MSKGINQKPRSVWWSSVTQRRNWFSAAKSQQGNCATASRVAQIGSKTGLAKPKR
jgi:hypothetical protein